MSSSVSAFFELAWLDQQEEFSVKEEAKSKSVNFICCIVLRTSDERSCSVVWELGEAGSAGFFFASRVRQ